MISIDVPKFINEVITGRNKSYFQDDMIINHNLLENSIKNKKALIIGGAGTIGASFIRAMIPFQPSKLAIIDHNENGLTEITRFLRSSTYVVPPDYTTYPIDFGSHIFEKVFNSDKWDIVACFAAHKHVRSEKDIYSIEAMIENNIFKTKKLLDLCLRNKPSDFFSVSTDKAANPVNVMGASKKLMESILLEYSREFKITTARFANVAFSNGSLLDGFLNRLNNNQPLSAPNDVKRYFVSPEESGQLCLLSCITANTGDICFPKLKEHEMKYFSFISDKFLEMLHLKPEYCSSEEEARHKALIRKYSDKTYPVYYSKSDTSGEKKYEEFYTEADNIDMDRYRSIGVIKSNPKKVEFRTEEIISALKDAFRRPDISKVDITDVLAKYIPEFVHIETGKSLDFKM